MISAAGTPTTTYMPHEEQMKEVLQAFNESEDESQILDHADVGNRKGPVNGLTALRNCRGPN